MVAVLYTFGMECHVGADKLSRFFKLIRIDTHVGISSSALRQQLSQMESLLPLFQQRCESSVSAQTRSAVVAMDETFFGEFFILALMDLSSGYLILEDISDDRRFDTWFEKAIPRLKALGIDVNHAGADVFHAQQDVCKWLGATLGRQHEQAKT